MNEFTILMHLLSDKSNKIQIGASKRDILNKLNLNGKNEALHFENLITQLSNYIKPLGLQIRFNPLSSHWYLAFQIEASDYVSANPFADKPRLAATLFYTLICCLERLGVARDPKNKGTKKEKACY